MTYSPPKSAKQLMAQNTIGLHLAGSRAYGTSTPTSDIDYRGIFVADPINIRTPFFKVEQASDETQEDTVLYELNQFMRLALDCNPNVVETLWVDPSTITVDTPAYSLLRQYAPQLLSIRYADATCGYALSQLKRIKGHNKWINQPQSEDPPKMIEFVSLVHNFTPEQMFKVDMTRWEENYRLVPYAGDVYGVYPMQGYRSFNRDTGSLNTDYEANSTPPGMPSIILKFNREVYKTARETWENYWTWKNNRNVVRSELEEKYGFDTKHGMHLVRLFRMGVEALETGIVHVKRPDAAELLTIRNGAWTYEQMIAYADSMMERVDALKKTTKLPKRPPIELAANLILQVQDLVWNSGKQ